MEAKKESLAVNVVHEGLLVKQGHFRKNWKVRYFVLGDDGLLGYWDYDSVIFLIFLFLFLFFYFFNSIISFSPSFLSLPIVILSSHYSNI